MSREPTSLVEVAVARGGFRKGLKAASFASEWAIARAALGRPLGEGGGPDGIEAAVREFAVWWVCSERTAWRRLADFRECFPELESPEPIAEILAPAYGDLADRLNVVDGAVKRGRMASAGLRGASEPIDLARLGIAL